MLEVVAALFRVVVDEADEMKPILRVVEEFVRDGLTHVAGSEDQSVLEIPGGFFE